MAISLGDMATATLILFLDVVFEVIEACKNFVLHIFLVLLLTVSVHNVCFQRN